MRFLQRAVFTLSCWDRRATPEFDTDKIDARMGDFIPIYIYAYIGRGGGEEGECARVYHQ